MEIVNTTGTLTVEKMKTTWNQDYHLIFIDQPTGVGWSPNGKDTNVSNTTDAANDFYTFITALYA